ncbi:hypothetical protein FVER14953_21506 [Fusarium verticillioides]|nr:hypothetical protein FVER14953_21506 [Fusarium verticillioides]
MNDFPQNNFMSGNIPRPAAYQTNKWAPPVNKGNKAKLQINNSQQCLPIGTTA